MSTRSGNGGRNITRFSGRYAPVYRLVCCRKERAELGFVGHIARMRLGRNVQTEQSIMGLSSKVGEKMPILLFRTFRSEEKKMAGRVTHC